MRFAPAVCLAGCFGCGCRAGTQGRAEQKDAIAEEREQAEGVAAAESAAAGRGKQAEALTELTQGQPAMAEGAAVAGQGSGVGRCLGQGSCSG
ncbi:MAG: hypothetical protein NZU63_12970 [Gemmataceae bacterium]|nr:hypothetical protein [Gemmataceae bacterium]